MATAREASAITKKQLAMRELHWPGAEPNLWQRRVNKGFTTIPKTMPMILKIMDEMTKGAPVSTTYLTLWCNTWDNSFAVLSKPGDMANASGFGGQRGEHTWATRMRKLQELHFIDIKGGKSGPMSNAIIWNPHYVLRWHHEQKTPGLTQASYEALIEWALDIGAKDMTDPLPDLAPAPAPVAPPMPAPGSMIVPPTATSAAPASPPVSPAVRGEGDA